MDEQVKLRLYGIVILVVALFCLVMTGTFGDEDNLLGLDLGALTGIIEDVIYVISALVAFSGGIIILKSLQSEKTGENS
ncbi:MAG: hypothetical protein ACE5OZ_23510 [Candidatus Heimdallarchaeota archaeon]